MNQPSRVCVIDDNSSIRDFVCRVLSDCGFETVSAADGVAGLKLVHEKLPAVVITDIVMDNGDGIELISSLRRVLGDNLPVIAMSGGGAFGNGRDYLELARDIGADAVLPKPFRPSELVSLVHRLTDPGP